MEQFLDRAEELLQAIVRFRDTSAITLLHHLRDLAEVLDSLKLYDECHLTGNCALGLAEALGRRSFEFRNEQAETFSLIAGLSVYQPRARTLFIQAVSLCEEVIATNIALDTNKLSLLVVLRRASYVLHDDYLCLQWLENAVQIMTKLSSSMVPDELSGVIYHNYGIFLYRVGQCARAVEAQHKAVLIRRALASVDPVKYTPYLAKALAGLGLSLHKLGKYNDAAAASKEALEHCRTASAQGTLQYSAQLAHTLHRYGTTLKKLNQVSKALEVEKEAASLYHDLSQTEPQYTKWHCYALYNYAGSCHSLGQHAEAVVAYQESISLLRALVALNTEEEKCLVVALHNMANSFNALGQGTKADAVATEALQMNQRRVLKGCNDDSCFVCQRAKAYRKKGKVVGLFRWNGAS